MTDPIFQSALDQLTPQNDVFVNLSFDIADRVHFLMQKKGWNGNDLANAMQKTPSEISRYLSGTHNFTLQSLAKLETVLGEPILRVVPAEDTPILHQKIQEAATFIAQHLGQITIDISVGESRRNTKNREGAETKPAAKKTRKEALEQKRGVSKDGYIIRPGQGQISKRVKS